MNELQGRALSAVRRGVAMCSRLFFLSAVSESVVVLLDGTIRKTLFAGRHHTQAQLHKHQWRRCEHARSMAFGVRARTLPSALLKN